VIKWAFTTVFRIEATLTEYHIDASCLSPAVAEHWLRFYFANRYPHCLHMLDLLQSEHFRKELMNSQCARFIDDQQLLHWQHYQRKRMRLLSEQAERTVAGVVNMQASASGPISSQTQIQQPHSASSTSMNK
jgi:hypothetical protein